MTSHEQAADQDRQPRPQGLSQLVFALRQPVDDGLNELLAKTGWSETAGENFPSDTSLVLDHKSPTTRVVVGQGYVVFADVKTRQYRVNQFRGSAYREGDASVSDAVLKAVFGAGVAELVRDPGRARDLVSDMISIDPPEQQETDTLHYSTMYSAQHHTTTLDDLINSKGFRPLEDLIAVHGAETLGVTLTDYQKQYLDSLSDRTKACEFVNSHYRFAKVSTPAGVTLLVGKPGCSDTGLAYLKGTAAELIEDSRPLRKLFAKFGDLEAELLGTKPAEFAVLPKLYNPRVKEADPGYRLFPDLTQENVRVPLSEVICIDLMHSPSSPARELRSAFRNIYTGTDLWADLSPSGVVQNHTNDADVMLGFGHMCGASKELYFRVAPGKRGSFLIYFSEGFGRERNVVYGVTVERSQEGKLSFSPYKPEYQIASLTHYEAEPERAEFIRTV